jgi:hypothetical protein
MQAWEGLQRLFGWRASTATAGRSNTLWQKRAGRELARRERFFSISAGTASPPRSTDHPLSRGKTMNMSRFLPWLALLAIWANTAASQTWTPLKNMPPVDIGYIALATDGTVLAHARTFSSADSQWYKLTPDINGSYVNGTWSQLASMPSGYAPIDFAGGMLADGKLLVEGGEYNEAQDVESNLGALYDPVSNTWTSISPPSGWSQIGDASGVILANGTFMMGQQGLFNSALFDETSPITTSRKTGSCCPMGRY